MRRLVLLTLAAAAAFGVGAVLVAGSEAAPAAQTGQDRFTVFEMHTREA